jgi:membrane protein required for colicin V production
MSINFLDVIIIIPLLLFAWQGYKKGFIIEVATLAALILGLFFAFYFSDYAANLLNEYFNIDHKYIAALSFIVTFIVVVLAIIAIGKILQKLIDIILLGFLNKAAGAVFGIIKGALILSIFLLIINYFDTNQKLIKEEYKEDSIFYKPVAAFAPQLYNWLHLDNFDFRIPDKGEIIKQI